MNFRSYKDMGDTLWKNLYNLPERYDLIVGIPRSDMIPATMLSLYLNAQLSSLDEFTESRSMFCGSTRTDVRRIALEGVRKVLVIDDSIYSGNAMREATDRIEASIELKRYDLAIDYAAVYSAGEKDSNIHFSLETVRPPRCFQWNIFNHPQWTAKTCYDIEGVVTRDPTAAENDDGPAYLDFVRNAPRRLQISYPIGAFVSSRLEKYRAETAGWLTRNGFAYKDLVLLGGVTAEERAKRGLHASFKASVYRNRAEVLFVESDARQAEEIAKLSGKDVFCTDTMQFFKGRR